MAKILIKNETSDYRSIGNPEIFHRPFAPGEEIDVGNRIPPERLNQIDAFRAQVSAGFFSVTVEAEADDILVLGGPGGATFGPPVQDVTALQAVVSADREDKQQRLVEDLGGIFHFDAQSTASLVANKVILPDDLLIGDPGRWILVIVAPIFHAVEHHSGGADPMDHGLIAGLGDDDHTQYALLSGVAARNDVTGTFDFGADGGLILPHAASPAPTTEGDVIWDSAGDVLTIGTGAATKTMCDTDSAQTLTNKTLTTPTIGDLTNAVHTHQDAAGGGQLDHGLAITGLADDDHTQYLNVTRHDTTDRHGSGVVDHGLIGGLGDDDHTQYPLLAGRITGQTLHGGNDAGTHLILRSTSSASKGNIFLEDDVVLGTIVGGAAKSLKVVNADLTLETETGGDIVLKPASGTINVPSDAYIGPLTGGMWLIDDLSAWNAQVEISDSGLKFTFQPGGSSLYLYGSKTTDTVGEKFVAQKLPTTDLTYINGITQFTVFSDGTGRAHGTGIQLFTRASIVGSTMVGVELKHDGYGPGVLLSGTSADAGKITRDSGDIELETTTPGDIVLNPFGDVIVGPSAGGTAKTVKVVNANLMLEADGAGGVHIVSGDGIRFPTSVTTDGLIWFVPSGSTPLVSLYADYDGQTFLTLREDLEGPTASISLLARKTPVSPLYLSSGMLRLAAVYGGANVATGSLIQLHSQGTPAGSTAAGVEIKCDDNGPSLLLSGTSAGVGKITRDSGDISLETTTSGDITLDPFGDVLISSYIRQDTLTIHQWGGYTTAEETTLVAGLGAGDAGATWYNSSTGKWKGWDGSSVSLLG